MAVSLILVLAPAVSLILVVADRLLVVALILVVAALILVVFLVQEFSILALSLALEPAVVNLALAPGQIVRSSRTHLCKLRISKHMIPKM